MLFPSTLPMNLNSKKKNRKAKIERGSGHEADRVQKRLSGFDVENCQAWKVISSKYGSRISHSELKAIANLICGFTNLRVDRDATRDNRVLIKWFDENWDQIQNFIPKIHLHDDNDDEILGS